MNLTRDFTEWLWMSFVTTLLGETLVYYMVLPEFRGVDEHAALQWLVLLVIPTLAFALSFSSSCLPHRHDH